MTPFVRHMHEKSGLLRLIERSEVSVEEAEQEALRLVTQHAPYRTARLCGNTIAQDRRFLYKYMPTFEAYLHYRTIDVSTLKELALWWHNVKFGKPDEGQHTALFDIRQSIAELKFYREQFFSRVSTT
jgi:oligoribonuclease